MSSDTLQIHQRNEIYKEKKNSKFQNSKNQKRKNQFPFHIQSHFHIQSPKIPKKMFTIYRAPFSTHFPNFPSFNYSQLNL